MANKSTATTATLERGRMSVTLSDEALGYLSAPPKHGASRVSAYHFLLASCAMERKTVNLPFGGTTELHPNQSLISVTELAAKMDWSRQTARIFLESLEGFGLIAKEQLDRCSVITVKLAEPTSGNQNCASVSDTIHFPSFIKSLVAEWASGKYTDSELADAIEMHVAQTAGSGNGQLAASLSRQLLMAWIVDVVETATSQSVSVNATSTSLTGMVADKFIERCQLPVGWRLWTGLVREGRRVAIASLSFAKERADLADATLCRVAFHLSEAVGNIPVPVAKPQAVVDDRQRVLPFDMPSEDDSYGTTATGIDGTAETHRATAGGL